MDEEFKGRFTLPPDAALLSRGSVIGGSIKRIPPVARIATSGLCWGFGGTQIERAGVAPFVVVLVPLLWKAERLAVLSDGSRLDDRSAGEEYIVIEDAAAAVSVLSPFIVVSVNGVEVAPPRGEMDNP